MVYLYSPFNYYDMKSEPKIFSSITFKILSLYQLDEEDKDYIDNYIHSISDNIADYLNRIPLNYKSDINDISQDLKIIKLNLNRFINHYNRNSSNRFYLWLDNEFTINKNDLFFRNIVNGDDDKELFELALNMNDELIQLDTLVDQNVYYNIFCICLFLRNSPLAIVRYT